MKLNYGVAFLVIAAFITIFTAFAHLSCIYFGPECFSSQMAPSVIVESAKEGTLLAPLGAVFVSIIFIILGCYALSAAGVVRKLPLLKLGIYSIAFLCIIRGVLPLQLWLRQPDKVSELVLYVGLVWLLTGLLYFFGFRAMRKIKV